MRDSALRAPNYIVSSLNNPHKVIGLARLEHKWGYRDTVKSAEPRGGAGYPGVCMYVCMEG